MPRDADVAEPSTITLPGFRRARVCPADDAGSVRLHVLDSDWLDRLFTVGLIDRDQHSAGLMLATLHEAAGLRAPVVGRYDGKVDASSDGGSPLETMNAAELKAWRKLHRLLRHAPRFTRGEVEAVCLHGLRPISIPRLRVGLAALAAAIRAGR